MPLKSGFTRCMQDNTVVVRHTSLQRRYPIRATEGYDPTSNSTKRILEHLEDHKQSYNISDYEVLQGIIKRLGYCDWEDLKDFSHIVIEREGKPVLIIENNYLEQTPSSICALIQMDELVGRFWQSDEEKERLACEEARRGIYRSFGVFLVLCSIAQWLGDL